MRSQVPVHPSLSCITCASRLLLCSARAGWPWLAERRLEGKWIPVAVNRSPIATALVLAQRADVGSDAWAGLPAAITPKPGSAQTNAC